MYSCRGTTGTRSIPVTILIGLIVLVTAAVAAAVTACGDREPIKLGFAGQISGSRANPSAVVRNGVRLAVEEVNADGGIGGRMVELIVRDDEGSPAGAREAVAELHEAGVEAMVGHTISSTAVATLDLINEKKLVTITPTATADELRGRDDYLFTLPSSNRKLAQKAADFTAHELDVDRMSVVLDHSNKAYTENFLASFREFFRGFGGSVVSEHPYRSDSFRRFEQLIAEALSHEPRGLLVLASSLDTAMIVQQLYKLREPIPVVAGDWASSQELILQGGPYVSHVYHTNVLRSSSLSEAFISFQERYQRRYSEAPSNGGALGYEAASILLEALSIRAESSGGGPGELKEILLGRSFQGLEEPLGFDRYGDIQRSIYIKQVRNNRFVDVLPEE
jgi:branched-chain amino acid transport system substrate-binding protein